MLIKGILIVKHPYSLEERKVVIIEKLHVLVIT